jgi:hypothetical protein
MKKKHEQSIEAIVEPADSMTIVDSFQYAAKQLKDLEERMQKSDRELYRAVGEFVDSTMITVQNLASEGLDQDRLLESSVKQHQSNQSPSPHLEEGFRVRDLTQYDPQDMGLLKQRYQFVQQEFKALLLTAFSNEEIDRLMKLDYLCSTLKKEIQNSDHVPTQSHEILFTKEKLQSEFSSLKKAKDYYNLSTSSWQGLADKLNSRSR